MRRAAGEPVAADVVAAIARASAGHAATAALLARRLVAALRIGHADSFRIDDAPDVVALLETGFAALGAEARRLIAALALVAEDPTGAAAGLGDVEPARAAAAAAAREAGWLVEQRSADDAGAPVLRLASEAHRRALVARLGDPELRATVERAIDQCRRRIRGGARRWRRWDATPTRRRSFARPRRRPRGRTASGGRPCACGGPMSSRPEACRSLVDDDGDGAGDAGALCRCARGPGSRRGLGRRAGTDGAAAAGGAPIVVAGAAG